MQFLMVKKILKIFRSPRSNFLHVYGFTCNHDHYHIDQGFQGHVQVSCVWGSKGFIIMRVGLFMLYMG